MSNRGATFFKHLSNKIYNQAATHKTLGLIKTGINSFQSFGIT